MAFVDFKLMDFSRLLFYTVKDATQVRKLFPIGRAYGFWNNTLEAEDQNNRLMAK